ncbi:MAG: KH domain-containing protein, partial [Candidatus Omnitrophica bacterium]|nr:KH domain-containing protein [Candidatus Omnitrophota bacterium]
RWNDDIKEYVKAAISPAEPQDIKVNKETKRIEVIVPDDQLSIGIGKHGQNVRLASKLIGWEIDIRGKEAKPSEEKKLEAQKAKEAKEGAAPEPRKESRLTDLEGVGPKIEKVLVDAGYDSVDKIKTLTVEDLTKLEGIGKKTAEKILKSAQEQK